MTALVKANDLQPDDFISVLFTATPDIRSKFPAAAARAMGLDDVPLIGAQELDVDGALPKCIRLLAHVETDKSRGDIRHVFQYGARALRADLVDKS
jgi:chorismate mutase